MPSRCVFDPSASRSASDERHRFDWVGVVDHPGRQYGDFKVNDAAAFALEFHPWVPLEVAEATPTSTSMEHVGGAEYEIVAQVIHATAKW